MGSEAQVDLSVVVVIVSDTTGGSADVAHLEGCLKSLEKQVEAPSLEIIVPYHSRVSGIDSLSTRYPAVHFLRVDDLRTYTGTGGSREHHDELRARGLAIARGRLVGLLEDHAQAHEHWAREAARAHQDDYAAVGGAIENGIDRALNWAVYFCDFGKYQNPLPAGPAWSASDANVTYKRADLEAIRSVWQECFHETLVNKALMDRKRKLALSPTQIVYQHRQGLRMRDALAERFVWGRSYASTRTRYLGSKRWLIAALTPVLPAVLLARMAANVRRKRRCGGAFVKALPHCLMLTVAWSWGELCGYVRPRADTAAEHEPPKPAQVHTARPVDSNN